MVSLCRSSPSSTNQLGNPQDGPRHIRSADSENDGENVESSFDTDGIGNGVQNFDVLVRARSSADRYSRGRDGGRVRKRETERSRQKSVVSVECVIEQEKDTWRAGKSSMMGNRLCTVSVVVWVHFPSGRRHQLIKRPCVSSQQSRSSMPRKRLASAAHSASTR